MIYVSSSCVRASTIRESVEKLVEFGYRNIELSGGTRPYAELENDLLELKSKYDLNFLCHNYFPPPTKDFVLNVASLDEEISEMSVEHVLDAIRLSKALDASKFAFHAGFQINIPVSQIGKKIEQQPLFDYDACLQRFSRNLERIREQANDIELYVENNVLSAANYQSFNQANPFFLTDASDLDIISPCKPLIDVAHLKVSCNSLGLEIEAQLNSFFAATDYVHISDNDGLADQNLGLAHDSELFKLLEQLDWSNKTITLEVYSGPDELKSTFESMVRLTGKS